MNTKQSFFALLVLTAVVLVGVGLFTSSSRKTPDLENVNQNVNQINDIATMNKESLAEYASHRATIKTNFGDIVLDLYGDLVPNTVSNFVKLSNEGFYEGIRFHRVISGFMIQSGDPNTRDGVGKDIPMFSPGAWGTGGPGYNFADEFDNRLRHSSAGVLSMANAGANTNGSQFFITLDPTPHLDNRHSVFGLVVEGMDVVEKIGETPVLPDDKPVEDVFIESIEVAEL